MLSCFWYDGVVVMAQGLKLSYLLCGESLQQHSCECGSREGKSLKSSFLLLLLLFLSLLLFNISP